MGSRKGGGGGGGAIIRSGFYLGISSWGESS